MSRHLPAPLSGDMEHVFRLAGAAAEIRHAAVAAKASLPATADSYIAVIYTTDPTFSYVTDWWSWGPAAPEISKKWPDSAILHRRDRFTLLARFLLSRPGTGEY
jgi:hypothetical protein